MTRGIQLKQLSAADLGHLGLPAVLLGGPIAGAYLADSGDADEDFLPAGYLSADAAQIAASAGDAEPLLPDSLAITREVRVCLEEALGLLIAALPPALR